MAQPTKKELLAQLQRYDPAEVDEVLARVVAAVGELNADGFDVERQLLHVAVVVLDARHPASGRVAMMEPS